MQIVQSKADSVNYKVREPLILESGHTLRDLRIQYTTYGHLNADKSNVVWVFHALTADSNAAEWWPGLVGDGFFINPEEHFIVCANILGSCYGTTEPEDKSFPIFTIADIVAAHKQLFKKLDLSSIKIGIGGSMGGQQLLEWVVQEPELFEIIVPIATNAVHSPWGIAFNETQRMAMEHPDPKIGLETARAIAMLSYRHYDTYEKSQFDDDFRSNDFSASSYQRYQGEKLEKRFSPLSYFYLSKAMDTHNIGRKYQSLEFALRRIRSRAVVIGIESDLLFPAQEQEFIAQHIQDATLRSVPSLYGHDGFLMEAEAIGKILKEELK
ncbi:MAG: homoserine O-acetyltransferase [Cyclobacteriaceae bacterium]